MQILTLDSPRRAEKLLALDRRALPDPAVRKSVEKILDDVGCHGDRALCRLTKRFGGPALDPKSLYVTPVEIAAARGTVAKPVRAAIAAARRNVAAFARRSLRRTWFRKNAQGAVVGERFDPFERVGLYIPGGTAPLVSTAVMTCTLASTAGVREIVAVTPPRPDGSVHPAVLFALAECGATEIYRVGGAQAVAALAHGTETIRPVDKIFGPGNAYVVEAKRQVFGRVAVDLLPGPSEVLVIADASADPDWVAADLLAQCEHGAGSLGVLLTDARAVLRGVEKAVGRRAARLARSKELAMGLANTHLIEVADMAEATRIANAFAPEHTAIATASPGEIAARLTTSGAIFLGALSPVAVGDFLAGPSHELPTGGAAKSFAGLTADQFQRRTSIIRLDKPSLRASLPAVETLSSVEGLEAHAQSVAVRLSPKNRRR
jgi:histidinol dehydrogenase